MRPRLPQTQGVMLDQLSLYSFNSNGDKILTYTKELDQVPFKVRKTKGLLELVKVMLQQSSTMMDPDLDPIYRRDRLLSLAKQYNNLSRYVSPKDIVLLNAYLTEKKG